ncbi:Trypsin-like protease precursor [Vibrio thalassae]|uniref:Trypsin-like protease n=1 Tax=Vibrio thalassae TaxID=1243014 RepID=A0A240EIC0_9VIBR|nr:serine protease [Vibrio thalassae]SNX48442.1 Trypsin-like protease precursor [Vibrio thalassae]
MILSLPSKRSTYTVLASTALSLSIISSVHAQTDAKPYIVNGSAANVADYPSFVSLYLDAQEYGVGYSTSPYCGGTLLNSQFVLTTAHCVYGDRQSQLLTMAAPNLQYESDYRYSEKRRVVEIYHPMGYIDDIDKLIPNDIAILKLDSPLGTGIAINRPNNESYRNVGAVFTAVGHGNTKYGYDAFDILQKVNLTYVDNAVCAGAFSDGSYLTQKQICFTGDYSNVTDLLAGTCQGDSGGPIYWDNNGLQVQIGVTSFGPLPCGDKQRAVTSVFTEIADYSDWINRVLNGQETPNYVSDDQARRNYLIRQGYTISPSGNNGSSGGSSSDSGGGGALHFALTALLIGLGRIRRRGFNHV